MTNDPRTRLLRLACGYMITQAIGVAVRLGIPELVSERARPSADLAAAVDADADSLRRLLRTLAAVGVFVERDGLISHTEMSELLCSDVPGSFAAQALLFSGVHYETWGAAVDAFRTGQPTFSTVFGSPFFDWLGEHPEDAAIFNAAMAGGAVVRRARLLTRDWSGVSTIVDVGGGIGTTLLPLLEQQTALTGIVFDLPYVGQEAKRTIEQAGLSDRCSFVGGSFFDGVPAGADVYAMAAILHDWDDEAASSILRSVHSAMQPDSRLVLLESVIGAVNEPDNAKFLDLHMLVALGGKERDESEWRDLLSSNGFSTVHIESGLIEAVPG
ncbi:MAG: methyltransferase [Nocardioidaceae bacterium]